MLRRMISQATRHSVAAGLAKSAVTTESAAAAVISSGAATRIGVPTTVGAGDFSPSTAMWSASAFFSTSALNRTVAAKLKASPAWATTSAAAAAVTAAPSSGARSDVLGRLRSPLAGCGGGVASGVSETPATVPTPPLSPPPFSQKEAATRYSSIKEGRAVRTPKHGTSTVVGRSRVHTTAESFRQAIKAPPFPQPQFTRELSRYKDHKEEEACKAAHPEIFANAAATASMGARAGTPATTTAAATTATTAATPAVATVTAAFSAKRGTLASNPRAPVSASAAHASTAVAPAPQHDPAMSAILDPEGDATTTAKVLAMRKATKTKMWRGGAGPLPDSASPTLATWRSSECTTNNTGHAASTSSSSVADTHTTALVRFQRMRAALMMTPGTETALWARITAPLAFLDFPIRSRVAVCVSMVVALAATYGLYRLLYFELVYYGLLRTPNKKKNAAAAAAVAAAGGSSPTVLVAPTGPACVNKGGSALGPGVSTSSADTPPKPTSSSAATAASSASHATTAAAVAAAPAATTAAGSASSSTPAVAPPAVTSAVPATAVSATAAAATKRTSAQSMLYAVEYYSCAGLVLLGFTVPYHVFFLGTASMMGKGAFAKKFLADWARALLPTRAAAWYGRLIRAPGVPPRVTVGTGVAPAAPMSQKSSQRMHMNMP